VKSILKKLWLKIKTQARTVRFALSSFIFNQWILSLKEGKKDTSRSFSLYWNAYGGYKALLRSQYIPLSLIISLVIAFFGDDKWDWSADTKIIIACTLGFSFAGYALILGIADGKFIKGIKGKFPDGQPSPLMVVASSFTHFFIIQCITMFWAICSSALGVQYVWLVKFIGIFLLLYSICVLFASALAALNFVSWYNEHPEDDEDIEP